MLLWKFCGYKSYSQVAISFVIILSQLKYEAAYVADVTCSSFVGCVLIACRSLLNVIASLFCFRERSRKRVVTSCVAV